MRLQPGVQVAAGVEIQQCLAELLQAVRGKRFNLPRRCRIKFAQPLPQQTQEHLPLMRQALLQALLQDRVLLDRLQ